MPTGLALVFHALLRVASASLCSDACAPQLAAPAVWDSSAHASSAGHMHLSAGHMHLAALAVRAEAHTGGVYRCTSRQACGRGTWRRWCREGCSTSGQARWLTARCCWPCLRPRASRWSTPVCWRWRPLCSAACLLWCALGSTSTRTSTASTRTSTGHYLAQLQPARALLQPTLPQRPVPVALLLLLLRLTWCSWKQPRLVQLEDRVISNAGRLDV